MRPGGEGDVRGWDGWMASLTQYTWVWATSRRQWRTGECGVFYSPWSCKEPRHNWATEQQQKQEGVGRAEGDLGKQCGSLELITACTILQGQGWEWSLEPRCREPCMERTSQQELWPSAEGCWKTVQPNRKRIRGTKALTSLSCLSLVSSQCSPLAKLKQMTKGEEALWFCLYQSTIWGKSRLKGVRDYIWREKQKLFSTAHKSNPQESIWNTCQSNEDKRNKFTTISVK